MPFPLRTRTRGRPSRNAGVVNVAAAPSFNPLTGWTTDPIHGVWASDPLWTPPADGGAVSSWRNGGTVGGDLAQADGAKQPTYRASTVIYNNKPTVQFDGGGDCLTVNPADVSQTYYLVLVGGPTTLVGTYHCGIGVGGSSRGLYVASLGPTYRLSFGTAVTGGTANAAPHLFVAVAAGASSSLAVDGVGVIASNAGVGSMTVLTLGAESTGFSDPLNGHIAYAAVFTSDPTAQAEWATFTAWVESYYNIPLP